MRAVRVVPGMTAVLISVVAVAVAGCGPFSSSSSVAATASSQPTSSAVSAPTAASATTPSATASSGAVQNLVATAAVKSELLAVFAASHNIPVSDVLGTAPGSVYYAYDPATQTYYAKATYEPKTSDPLSVTVGFQDGGQGGYFKKSGSAPWQVESMGQPAVCTALRFFPSAVLAVWDNFGLPAPSSGTC